MPCKQQVAALQAQLDASDGTSQSARQVTLDLANATTMAQSTLAELQRVNEIQQQQIDAMQTRLYELEDQQAEQITKALAAGQTRQRLQQEASNRALNEAARAEERAVKAEAVAAKALRDAEASRRINDGSMTRAELVAIVQAELQASTPGTVELAVAEIRDQFPAGLGGPRLDADYVKQQKA